MKIEKGLYCFKNNYLGVDIENLEHDFDLNYKMFPNKNYKNVSSINNWKQFDTNLRKIYQSINQNFKLAEQGYLFEKVWFVQSEHKNCDITKLPYIPHIDKDRFLKVMIYVTGVAEKDGPFFCIVNGLDREFYEKKRLTLGENHKAIQSNKIEDFERNAYQPIIGSKGDVIIFDTNIPHHAGIIAPSGLRKVIRFDFELKHWNKPSIQKKIANIFS